MSFRLCECYVTFFSLAFVASLLVDASLYKNGEIQEGWERHRRTNVQVSSALALDALITVTHLATPVRWIVSVWTDSMFVLGFAVYSYIMFED